MPSEQLIQQRYLATGKLIGDKFGNFEELSLGATNALALVKAGLVNTLPKSVDFPFELYKPTKKTSDSKLDMVYFRRMGNDLEVVAVKEMKKPVEFNNDAKRLKAAEQALFSGAVVDARIGIASDGTNSLYIDIPASLREQELVFVDEKRDFNPGVLNNLLDGGANIVLDPSALAEKTWQAIWHATKAEPKECLMTFVEIFILKFLSDNLRLKDLPERYSFYELTKFGPKEFAEKYGETQIEYYVLKIRPQIKAIFPDNTVVTDQSVLDLFGLETIVSKKSIINGFAFLQTGNTSLSTFNRTFLEILGYFKEFGTLTRIYPEFKLRLYESFLKKSIRQSKLGQFFTPRNIVRAMIDMAQLSKLQDGAVVMDPAAGVGGFILEPLIESNALANNITFDKGIAKQRIRLIGTDVDTNTNIRLVRFW